MSDLPSGTVTFLFTDIKGSTLLLKQLRERYSSVVGDHRRLLRDAFAEHGGAEIDSQGDSFFVAFRRAKHAVAAAAAAQRALQAHTWPEGAEVRVRMGIHTGEAELEDGRYHGVAVHRGARIMAAAHGGQVLLSQTTRDVLEDEEADQPGVSLRDLGAQLLKDLDRPVRLYQLVIDGLPSKFPRVLGLTDRRDWARRLVERRRVLLALALAATAVLTAGLVVFVGHSGAKALSTVDANQLGVLDAERGEIEAQVPVGVTPSAVATSEDAIWVTNADSHTVSRIDPVTRTIQQTVKVGSEPSGIAVGGGAVWVANSLEGTVSRIEPQTNEPVDKIRVGNGPSGVAFGAGSVWVTNSGDGTVSRINARSGHVEKRIPAGAGAGGIAFGENAVWVANHEAGTISKIDPRTNDAVPINVGNGPSGVAVGIGAVWVVNTTDGTVMRIDPQTNSVNGLIRVDGGPSAIAVYDGQVWVTSEFNGMLSRIDPSTGRVARRIKVGNRPEGIALADGKVFFAVRAAGGAHRGGTLIVLVFSNWVSLAALDDPALCFCGWMATAYDGLVAFRHVGGSQGAQLVPNLATALPTVTDGGKTYRFHLRPNVHYSNGKLVKPVDFRYAFERDFKLKSPASGYFSKIVGGAKCVRRPMHCDLSKGIVADDARGSVTFHLVARDAEFLEKLALSFASAVPVGTPIRNMGTHPPPATGPYVIASASAKQITMVRNPRFREWSKAAKPDGYVDRIVLRVPTSVKAALKSVERGEADFAEAYQLAAQSPATLRDVLTRHPGQAYFNPFPWTNYFWLNTRVAPFNDVRVRRAVNYAFDRGEAVRLQGGEKSSVTTCQVLPPNFPGYRPYCPYTRNPSPNGAWTAPDLAKAERLITRSGTRGMHVTVWACGDPQCGANKASARYFVSLLRRLGYRARLKVIPAGDQSGSHYFATVGDSRRKVQAAFEGWYADYPAASNFFNVLLSCSSFQPGSTVNLNRAEFCDRKIDAQIKQALEVQTSDPGAASALWARIDHEIVDQAPWVPLLNPQALDVVSRRVGNYQFNPRWNALVDQLWVH